MSVSQISPRIVLGIIIAIIGIFILWKRWNGKLSDTHVLTGIALILAGFQLSWMEIDEATE
jgi:drug/metabolite transporter (DMT)-like permease